MSNFFTQQVNLTLINTHMIGVLHQKQEYFTNVYDCRQNNSGTKTCKSRGRNQHPSTGC